MNTKQPVIHAIGNRWVRHRGEGKGVASSNGEESGRLSGGGGIWLEGLLVCSYRELEWREFPRGRAALEWGASGCS